MAEIMCAYTELKPIHKLIEHPKNPHRHSKEQIERLANIIDYQGIRHPIIVSKRSGFIVAGHGRLQALKKLKLGEVPIDYQDFEDEASEYSFIVSDNAIGKDEWAALDIDQIKKDIEILPVNVQMLGLKDFEIKQINEDASEDEVPEPPKTPRTKLGDLIELGEHRLLCGDSTDTAQVEKLMNGQKADIVFTSPPYNIGRSKGGSNSHVKYNSYKDDLSDDDYFQLLKKFLENASLFTRYQFVNIQFLDCNRIAFISWLFEFKNKLKDIMVWNKKHGGITPDYVLHSVFENIFIFDSEEVHNRSIKLNDPLKGVGNVIERQENMIQTESHKAGFPIYLPEYIINTFKPESIYEPFAGTGTTAIACEKTKRKCFMIEIDPYYIDVIISRWCNYTGKDQIKINGKEIKWSVDE